MKKIVLIVGLAFGCSALYAQGVQTGDNNTANINTSAANNANSSVEVTQIDGNQNVTVTQGPDNPGVGFGGLQTTTRQRNLGAATPSMGNFMRIMQAGTDNVITADQLGRRQVAILTQRVEASNSTITTSQAGERNYIEVDQANGNYSTVIHQGRNLDGNDFALSPSAINPSILVPTNARTLPTTIRNTAQVVQGDGNAAGRGSLVINQRGDAGYADVNQRGGSLTPNTINIFQNNNGGAEVTQDGNNNDVDIDQNGFQAAIVQQAQVTVNGVVSIQQGVNKLDDTRNTAEVRQLKGDGNIATVNQNFTNSQKNSAFISQSGTRAGAGTNSEVIINQESLSSNASVVQEEGGTNNDVTITQQNSQLRFGNEADVTQNGDANEFDATQNGNWNSIGGTVSGASGPGNFTSGTARQEGEDNEVDIDQDGSNNQVAIMQDGSDNTIEINQENEDFNAVGNKATAMQAGGSTDSDITINQNVSDGDANEATVMQGAGDDNTTTITQLEGNVATVTQDGDEEDVSGQGSTVVIDQSESTDGTATVDQGEDTEGNEATITQVQLGNTATINQTAGRLNEATIDQNDDNNTATINQSGTVDEIVGGPSTVDITQDGKGATATVTQAANSSSVTVDQESGDMAEVTQEADGLDNTVTINQEGTLAGGGNTANITQGGDENTFDVDQTSVDGFDGNTVEGTQGGSLNTADVDQDGPNNMATVTQDGEENDIDIDQNSEAASGMGDVATATQGPNTADSEITIDQSGNEGGNTATVEQTRGDNNVATVIQLKGNTATITQSGDDADVLGLDSEATIDQSGSTDGTAEITKAEGTLGNAATITQVDIENDATINQLAGIANEADVIQIGEGNDATVNQSGSYNVLTGTESTVGIAQTGNDNTATATQAAGTFGGTILIGQIPLLGSPSVNGNTATVEQTAGTLNLAVVTQNDDNNTATVTQSGTTDAGSGDNSTVLVLQAGKGGDVTVTQAADGSTVAATQFNGNGNSATIDQADLGRANNVLTLQAGDNNTLTLDQAGQENDASIIQSNLLDPNDPANGPSAHTATLDQSGTLNQAVIGQGGFRNTADLTQAGQENFATSLQYGSDNTATTNQTSPMRNNTVNITQGRITNGGGSTTATDLNTARNNRDAGAVIAALGDLDEDNTIQSEGNEATVNQIAGENQVVNVWQAGDMETVSVSQGGSDNNARTNQAGEMDELTIVQSGSQQLANANQYGEETQMGNDGTIDQSGSNNSAELNQIKFGNVAEITQSGTTNNAFAPANVLVTQVGENNGATVTQSGRRGAINVIQGDATGLTFGGQTLASTGYDPTTNDAFDNTADVTQSGLDNLAGSVQQGDDGTSTIMQAGTNNTIGILQENQGIAVRSMNNTAEATQETGTDGNVIDIVQSGQQNMGSAMQTNNVARSTINLTQRKDNNMAMLTQSQGDQNVISVRQIPDNFDTQMNEVEISQAGSENEARLEQTGYNNSFSLTQTGNEHTVQQNGGNPFALQSGNGNTAELTQSGNGDGAAGGHTINFNQSGTSNMAMIDQSGTGDNTITLVQQDDDNEATLSQDEGSNNVIVVNQNPDNAGTIGGMVMISQTGGSDNEARLNQTGKENELTLTQDGDGNLFRLSGGNNTAVQAGQDNTALLSQTGEDHVINFQQGGLRNSATITQMNGSF